MTILSAINKSGPYNGNGVTAVFGYGFSIADETHIKVISTDPAGVETVLTLGTHYTVSGVGAANGSITRLVAPATGFSTTLIRNVPYTQGLHLVNQGAYYAESVEAALDAAVARDQQLQEQVSRSVKLPASADSSALDALIASITRLAASATNIDIVAGSIAAITTVAANVAGIVAAGASAISSAAAAAASAAAALVSQNAAAASAAAAAASAGATTTVEVQINAAADIAPTDDDFFGYLDTTTGSLFKRTWANLKALLASTFLKLAGAQTITGGFSVTPNSIGNITSFTVNPALGNYQYGTNHGAATWTAPASDCAVDILITNDASAGSITFSGFTVASGNTGDSLTTTNTHKFIVSIRRINAVSTYIIKALQ